MMLALFQAAQIQALRITRRLEHAKQITIKHPRPLNIRHSQLGMGGFEDAEGGLGWVG
jgi:hypothetical protein